MRALFAAIALAMLVACERPPNPPATPTVPTTEGADHPVTDAPSSDQDGDARSLR